MSTLAIELNDAGILMGGLSGAMSDPDPGYALFEDKKLVLGLEAQGRARLKPRWVDNRFWVDLDSGPMPKPFPRGLSRADVAHAQLARLWDRSRQEQGSASVLLVVPGSFTTQQLALILGIARAAEMPVTGLVDAAVAAASTRVAARRVLHLDATLHRLIWTEMVIEEELTRRRVEVLETAGLASIRDAWAKHITGLLVRRTRFDPFHHGGAEQTLYDLLPGWLEELADEGQAVGVLESGGKERAVELGREDIDSVSESLLMPVLEMGRALSGMGEPATLMLTARAATIPGLKARLTPLAGRGVMTLAPTAALSGALEHGDRIASPGADLPFVLRLPVDSDQMETALAPDSESVQAEPEPPDRVPTHLLFEGTARAIGPEALWLGSAIPEGDRGLELGGPLPGLSRRHCAVLRTGGSVIVEDHSSFGTFLNDRRIEGRSEARIGDRLRLGSPGVELLFIAVTESHV